MRMTLRNGSQPLSHHAATPNCSRSGFQLPSIYSCGRHLSSENNDILKKIMIFFGREALRGGSPPALATFSPHNCSARQVLGRNLTPLQCIETLLDKMQIELESRLTGRRKNLPIGALALGHTISQIRILEDVRRACK